MAQEEKNREKCKNVKRLTDTSYENIKNFKKMLSFEKERYNTVDHNRSFDFHQKAKTPLEMNTGLRSTPLLSETSKL